MAGVDASTVVATADKMLAYAQLLARKDAAIATDRATELADINANEGTGAGAFANTTDSTEAIRDTAPLGTAMRGTDSAALAATALSNTTWTDTKAGYIDAAISSRGTGTALDAVGVRTAVGLATANLDTQLAGIANATAIADAILGRDLSNAEATAAVHSLATLILAGVVKANTIDFPGYLTIYRTNGTTIHAKIPISIDAAAEPIDGVG
jgi:hypothetical protein